MPNKKRKCKQCKQFTEADKGIKTPVSFFCGTDCARDFALDKIEKDKKKRRNKLIREEKEIKKANRKALRDFNRKDIRWQHKQTQKAFNKMRVLQELKWFKDRNIKPYCISCKKTNMDWCCGHYKTVGAQGGLRYDRLNTHLQCNRYCNMGLSGNLSGNKNTVGYTQGLIDRFGEDRGLYIIDYCNSKKDAVKWTCQELESMRSEFNRNIRELS